jgi:hypothetical protein
MMLDNKDHLGWNDSKDSHYNLKQSNGLVDLDLMPNRVFNQLCVLPISYQLMPLIYLAFLKVP